VPDMHAALHARHRAPARRGHRGHRACPPGDGADLIPGVPQPDGSRETSPSSCWPIARGDGAAARCGATDYLAKPYSPPMLRARVRAWLARTLVAYTETLGAGTLEEAVTLEDARDDRGATQTLLASMLAGVPLFRALSATQLNKLVAQATEQVYPAGYVIARQGEPPRICGYCCRGACAWWRRPPTAWPRCCWASSASRRCSASSASCVTSRARHHHRRRAHALPRAPPDRLHPRAGRVRGARQRPAARHRHAPLRCRPQASPLRARSHSPASTAGVRSTSSNAAWRQAPAAARPACCCSRSTSCTSRRQRRLRLHAGRRGPAHRWRTGSARPRGRPTWWRATAATSSRCCCWTPCPRTSDVIVARCARSSTRSHCSAGCPWPSSARPASRGARLPRHRRGIPARGRPRHARAQGRERERRETA
jgi:hypothetical protein